MQETEGNLMRWIAATAALLPATVCAAFDQPQGSGGLGMGDIAGLLLASVAVGWVTHQVVQASGRYSPQDEGRITAVAALFGGPFLWYVLQQL